MKTRQLSPLLVLIALLFWACETPVDADVQSEKTTELQQEQDDSTGIEKEGQKSDTNKVTDEVDPGTCTWMYMCEDGSLPEVLGGYDEEGCPLETRCSGESESDVVPTDTVIEEVFDGYTCDWMPICSDLSNVIASEKGKDGCPIDPQCENSEVNLVLVEDVETFIVDLIMNSGDTASQVDPDIEIPEKGCDWMYMCEDGSFPEVIGGYDEEGCPVETRCN